MGSDQASFERREAHGLRTLVVTGELDMANASSFLQELLAVADEAQPPALVDLSSVTFLDSSAISALVKAHHRLEGTNVSLVLVNPAPACRSVLELAGIDQVFEIVDRSRR